MDRIVPPPEPCPEVPEVPEAWLFPATATWWAKLLSPWREKTWASPLKV